MENRYKFKITNGCEYSLSFELEATGAMLRAGINKAISFFSIMDKRAKTLDMPEYFEVPENLKKLVELKIKNEVKKIIRTEQEKISNAAKKKVLIFLPTLKECKYIKRPENKIGMLILMT